MSIKSLCLVFIGLAASVLGQTRSYRIGEVPPLEVLQGSTLDVQLTSTQAGATISYTVDPPYSAPAGVFSMSGGRIRYSPSAADKFAFRVTFVSKSGNSTVDAQSVLVRPIPPLGPETDLISGNTVKVPDPESRDYVAVTQQVSVNEELFNAVRQRVRSVQVTGKTLVLEETPDRQALFARLNNKADVKVLTLFAERVVIRSALRLPGTNITIWAKEASPRLTRPRTDSRRAPVKLRTA
jgi:hypothetical protein